MDRQDLVVIGNGMAGARAMEEIIARGGGERFRITVFGDEPYGNYNRIMLSSVLADGGRVGDGTALDDLYLNPMDWYVDNDVTLHAGVRVVRIDRFARKVFADDGTVLGYDKLIVATGSRTFFPQLDGMWADDTTLTPGVFGFRTIDDTTSMVDHARDHRSAVVIGGGLLGLEAAHGLQRHGVDVHVVQGGPVLMNQQLDEEAGAILRRILERDHGIRVHTGQRPSAIRSAGSVTGVVLSDGTVIDAEMVVVTAGIRPNVGLGVVSGLTVERAIVVDDRMRSVDDADIFVVGECAQHRGQVYGLVAPLWEQASVLADVLTGADPDAEYHGSRNATKLKVAGVDVASMGVQRPEREDDEFVRFSEPRRGVYKSVVLREGRLIGATLLGDTEKVAFLQQSFDRGLPLPTERAELLFTLSAPSATESVAEMDDSAQVCNCNGVSKATIAGCVAGGETSVSGVMAATRAGKGCGSCKGLVEQIVTWAAEREGAELTEDGSAGWYVPAIPLAKAELIAEIRSRDLRSVSAVFDALAPDGEHAGSKMALASLLRTVWNADVVDERDARYVNDRVHANIQRDGTFSVVPRMSGGVTTADELRRIADTADRFAIPMIKVTGGQRIDLLGVRKEDLPAVWESLGMPSGYAYGKSTRTVKTCVGTDFCRFGLGDSTQLGIDIEERFKGLEGPAKTKLAVSGCPRNCAESMVKDVGVVAVGDDRWEVYVGGAAGASVRKGDVLATVDGRDEVLRLTGVFLQYYRESANWLERTYDFVPRVGLGELQALLVDDRDGIVAGLEKRMQEAVESYMDPWSEGSAPATSGQFSDALPLLPLPQVPVRDGSTSPAGAAQAVPT